MSDPMETPLICAAAGDPCIAEIPKALSTDKIAKIEDPEVASNTEAMVVAKKTSHLDDKDISFETPLLQENCDITNILSNALAPTTKPEVLASSNGNDVESAHLSNLQEEIEKRTNERDNYERKLGETEKKLAELEKAYEAATSGKDDQSSLRREVKELKASLAQSQSKLNDRARLMANQENQINALGKQVSSLKEVVSITKNLLEIRNMEVKHLQEDVDSMENRITAERERHNTMLRKMDAAVRLNADLKNEYETQLRLFQDLRGKYQEKVALLTNEDKASDGAVIADATATRPDSIQ